MCICSNYLAADGKSCVDSCDNDTPYANTLADGSKQCSNICFKGSFDTITWSDCNEVKCLSGFVAADGLSCVESCQYKMENGTTCLTMCPDKYEAKDGICIE